MTFTLSFANLIIIYPYSYLLPYSTAKLMMLEAEKQRWSGRLQRAEEALADVLWKRDSANQNANNLQNQKAATLTSSINFKPAHPRRRIDSLSDTETDCLTYYSLASQGMLDISELSQRKISSALSMPVSRRMTGASMGSAGESSLKTRQSRNSRTPSTSYRHKLAGIGIAGSISGRASSLTSLSFSRNSKTANSISSVSHRPLTNPKDGSLILQLPNPEAYKGYTPTGAPVNRERAGRRSLDASDASSSHMSVSSMGDFSSGMLTPMAYVHSASVFM